MLPCRNGGQFSEATRYPDRKKSWAAPQRFPRMQNVNHRECLITALEKSSRSNQGQPQRIAELLLGTRQGIGRLKTGAPGSTPRRLPADPHCRPRRQPTGSQRVVVQGGCGIVQGFGNALIEPVWAKIRGAAKNMPKAQTAENEVVFATEFALVLPPSHQGCLTLPDSSEWPSGFQPQNPFQLSPARKPGPPRHRPLQPPLPSVGAPLA